MKKLIMLITALLLSIIISGCNGTDDTDNYIGEQDNGMQENGIEMPGDLPGDTDIDSDIAPAPPHANGILELFVQLALEMDEGGHTTTRDRVVELFGTPRSEDENLLVFDAAADFGILARLSEGMVDAIAISPIPDFFINEALEPDHERLRSYENNTDGLTLDYFVELFGTPGFLTTYSDGIFSYTWRSSAFFFWIGVRGNNEVDSVFFEDYFDTVWDDAAEQSLLVLPDDVMQAIYNLAREMQDNNGQISEDRVKEIIGLDYNVSEQLIIFRIADDVEFFTIVEDTGMVEFISMSLATNFYFNESLPIDINDLEDLVDNAIGMDFDEFEDSIGVSGTFWQYTLDDFRYIWITPDTTVLIRVNQNNEIFDASISHFAG